MLQELTGSPQACLSDGGTYSSPRWANISSSDAALRYLLCKHKKCYILLIVLGETEYKCVCVEEFRKSTHLLVVVQSMAAQRHGLFMPRPPPQLPLEQLSRTWSLSMDLSYLSWMFHVLMTRFWSCSLISIFFCVYLVIKDTTLLHIETCLYRLLGNLLKVTLDPVQPSRAKANWLMGETTRSTLTALHGLHPDSDSPLSSLDRWRLCWPLWCWLSVRGQVSGFVSGVLRVCMPFSAHVSGCAASAFFCSLKMEKHLSKRSMLEEGRAGPSSDSR